MNAIQKALTDIKFQIPSEILNIGFNQYDVLDNRLVNIDEKIMSRVIRPRVMMDANLVGGIEIRINVGECGIQLLSDNEFIITVPKTLTSGRPIISALSLVSTALGYMQTSTYPSMQGTESVLTNMANNLDTQNLVQTSKLELIAENTILVQDPTVYLQYGVMRVIIANDTNMSNINARSYLAFSKLCILAVKAYIHNYAIVKMGRSYISNGHELGIVKEIIDSYSDANNEYLEYLNTTWSQVAFANDSDKMSRLISSMISNTI